MNTKISLGGVARMPTISKRNSGSKLKGLKAFRLPWLLIICVFATSALAQTAPPNIVVILADDLGYGDVGFNGCADIPTPNIDSLATNGARCLNGYVTHPFCSPSRASLMTGRYQQRFGYENQPLDDASNPRLGLPMTETPLPEILKPAGYVCGAIGKWHLGYAPNLLPNARGFDEFFGFSGAESNYINAKVLRDTMPLVEPEYLTDAFSREAESFIIRHAAEPFFLYLAYNAPHSPYQATQAYLDRVPNISDPGRRTYAAMIVALDDGVGRVLEALRAQDLLDNTLIFFLSDNGAPPVHSFVSNYPLRGYKLDVYEGGIRVPFVVQWSGRLPANTAYSSPVSSLDIVSTAAAVASVALPAGRTYDGLNLIPYLAGEQTAPRRTLFWRWFGLGAENGPPGSVDTIYAVRSGSFKLVQEKSTPGVPSLYNLTNDISETSDLAQNQPTVVDSLKKKYAQWNASTVPPAWTNRTLFSSSLPVVLAGDWNGFNKDDSTSPWVLQRTTAPSEQGTPDGFNWFMTTIHVAATAGDTTPGLHTFALIGNKSYSTQWGGVVINVDNTTATPFFSGTELGPTNSISLLDGFYYSFRLLDPLIRTPASLTLAVMKTSAPPVSVSRFGQTPLIPKPGDAVVVSIATSKTISSEERVYLRWTTDSFITSNMVRASGSGVSYSATIPAQQKGAFVQYSILTSTVDFAPVLKSGEIDPLILATTGTFNAAGK